MIKIFCCECHKPIDTKKHNVGRDDRLVECSDCVAIKCAGVPKEMVQDKLSKKFSKQRGRGNR